MKAMQTHRMVQFSHGHDGADNRVRRIRLAFGAVLGSLLMSTPAAAQVLLETIVVTAQKRAQDAQDVGISITAFSGSQFRDLGYTSSADIAAQTPGLNISTMGTTTAFVNIRGVTQNDFADHYEAPVAIYVDDAYVSAMGAANVQTFDLERVEILRGPQGTLFGRNATGGLLHYVSKKPTDHLDAYSEITLAEHNQLKFEGAIGGPLSSGLKGRLSLATNQHDGWLKNRIGPDLGDAETYVVRGQLLADLSEATELLLKGTFARDDAYGTGYSHQANGYSADGWGVRIGRNDLGTFLDAMGNPFNTCVGCDAYGYRGPNDDPREVSNDTLGYFDRKIYGASAKLTHDFGGISLTVLSDYFKLDKAYQEDTDAGPYSGIAFFTDQDLKQFSQEVRLNGTASRLNWTAGLYYLTLDNETSSGLDPFDLGPFLAGVDPDSGQPLDSIPVTSWFNAVTKTTSWAAFAHTEYELSDQWSVTGAVRYTRDVRKSDYLLQSSDDFFGPPTRFSRATSPFAKRTYGNYSAKLQLSWKPDDDTLLYAGVNRGHKAGNFNYVFLSFEPLDFSTIPHDEEVLISYEAGYKSTLRDGLARLNISTFYYDYQDHQASFFVNLSNTIGNIDASAVGGEIELVVSPTDRLELSAGASYIDTKTKDVGLPDGTIGDRELAYSPTFSLSGLIRYIVPLKEGDLSFQVDGNYTDDFCFTVVCHPSEQEDAYFVANGRITYKIGDGRWSASIFARNFTNTTYRVYAIDSAAVGVMTSLVNPPRWFGATLGFQW